MVRICVHRPVAARSRNSPHSRGPSGRPPVSTNTSTNSSPAASSALPTSRLASRRLTVSAAPEPEMPAIFAFWRGQHFMTPFIKTKKSYRAKVLISRHRDGEFNVLRDEDFQRPIDASEPAGVRVVDQHDLRHVAAKLGDVAGVEGRAHRGDDVRDAALVRHHHVGVVALRRRPFDRLVEVVHGPVRLVVASSPGRRSGVSSSISTRTVHPTS